MAGTLENRFLKNAFLRVPIYSSHTKSLQTEDVVYWIILISPLDTARSRFKLLLVFEQSRALGKNKTTFLEWAVPRWNKAENWPKSTRIHLTNWPERCSKSYGISQQPPMQSKLPNQSNKFEIIANSHFYLRFELSLVHPCLSRWHSRSTWCHFEQKRRQMRVQTARKELTMQSDLYG